MWTLWKLPTLFELIHNVLSERHGSVIESRNLSSNALRSRTNVSSDGKSQRLCRELRGGGVRLPLCWQIMLYWSSPDFVTAQVQAFNKTAILGAKRRRDRLKVLRHHGHWRALFPDLHVTNVEDFLARLWPAQWRLWERSGHLGCEDCCAVYFRDFTQNKRS